MHLSQIRDFARLLISPKVNPTVQVARIDFMELNILLPVKCAIIGFLFYVLYASRVFPDDKQIGDLSLKTLRQVYWVYAGVSCAGMSALLFMHRLKPWIVQWLVSFINLSDAVFLASLTVLTGVMKEITYWAFLFLIVRNAVSTPVGWLQIPLNLLTIAAYVTAGVYDKALIDVDFKRFDMADAGLTPEQIADNSAGYQEALTLRILLMLLLVACCYALHVLFEQQREAEDELREHVVRQEQMQTAGRLAAEIAHRIKNPLAIINNAVFALRRALKDGKGDPNRQLQLIQEEIERSDRIITELMGYAQMAEGKIEKLDVIEEVEKAIEQVFPPGAKYDIQIHRDFSPGIPPLQMQRGHFRDIIVNVLLNARDALKAGGNIWVSARSDTNFTVTMAVKDDGPGIPADKHERIFEPYVTGKEKGTGLGLAIVKHNSEIYGGHVALHSELGKGAEFVIQIPAKTMMRMRK